jgi:DNA polymerase-3 subunit beta
LAEGFGIAQAIATTRSTRPVLQNLLISASSDGVVISATDMEIGIKWKMDAEDCQILKEGSALLPAARLSQIARIVESEEISISKGEAGCTVKGGRSTFEVMTENVEDFPEIPNPPPKSALEIDAMKFADMTKKTIFAAARESTRYALNGVHLEVKDGHLEMVATDGRRMALVREKVGKQAVLPAAIVPQKALAQVERLQKGDEETLGIAIGDRQIFFAGKRGIVVSRLIEGHFPPYNEVIPRDNNKKAVLNRGALLSAMRQAALMTSEESKSVVMSFNDGELTVTGRAPDEGSSEVKVDAKYEGEKIEIRFNPQFIIDCLATTASEEITLEMKEPSTPALLKDGTGFLYVVMPIHIV